MNTKIHFKQNVIWECVTTLYASMSFILITHSAFCLLISIVCTCKTASFPLCRSPPHKTINPSNVCEINICCKEERQREREKITNKNNIVKLKFQLQFVFKEWIRKWTLQCRTNFTHYIGTQTKSVVRIARHINLQYEIAPVGQQKGQTEEKKKVFRVHVYSQNGERQ